jgi:hypothetical protein
MTHHETEYKGWDGEWFEFECQECGYHILFSGDDFVKLDRGDETALHRGSSTPDLSFSVSVGVGGRRD